MKSTTERLQPESQVKPNSLTHKREPLSYIIQTHLKWSGIYISANHFPFQCGTKTSSN